MYLRNQWKRYAQNWKYMCILKVYPGRRDFKAHGKEETGNGICAVSSLQLWHSWWIVMRAVADAGRPVQIHFTERCTHPRDNSGVVTLLNVPIGQWEWGLRPMTPDKPWGAIHAPALPEGSDRGLETSELCLCLAASPAWPCLWGKHSWGHFLHKSGTQEPHFQALLPGLPTWDTCPPGSHSFCLPASVCKVCTRESSNPPATL